MAALAPAGLPKDVTPEEVAAIAAAAAQMQMVASALRQEHQASASGSADSQSTAIASQPGLEQVPEISRDAPAAVTETKLETPPESKKKENKAGDPAGEPAAVETHRRRKGDVSPEVRTPEVRVEDAQDVPVTMAATAESVVAASVGSSRWTAVSVALEGSESAISLDQEMQKAYAAVAAAGSTSIAAIPQVQSAPAIAEIPATISNRAPEPAPEPESARNITSVEAGPVPVAQSEPSAVAAPFEAAAQTPIAAVNPSLETSAEASATAASKQDESKQEPRAFPNLSRTGRRNGSLSRNPRWPT